MEDLEFYLEEAKDVITSYSIHYTKLYETYKLSLLSTQEARDSDPWALRMTSIQ